LTIVNSLLQRTDNGQRQNCQARSPSQTEKKMIALAHDVLKRHHADLAEPAVGGIVALSRIMK
jgi:hypothetical protein